jgi:hypothetical protein
MTTDLAGDLVLIRCHVCGATVLADPEYHGALLWHGPDGAHRVITDGTLGGVTPLAQGPGAAIRAEVLGLAVRLRDLADDVADLAARLP